MTLPNNNFQTDRLHRTLRTRGKINRATSKPFNDELPATSDLQMTKLICRTQQLHIQRHRQMVYCPKCGTKNEDTADFCANCGASLQTGTVVTRRQERRKAEQQCFGLPHGGAIAGIVLGLIVLLWGGYMVLERTGMITGNVDFWIIIIIIFGVLMISGAIYQITRGRKSP